MKQIERQPDGIVVLLDRDDQGLLVAGLREMLEALEDWEFETRTGFRREQAEQLLNWFQKLDKEQSSAP